MSFELNLKLPGAEALAVAEKELRETEENVKDGLAKLRAYLEGEFSRFRFFNLIKFFFFWFDLIQFQFFAGDKFFKQSRWREFNEDFFLFLS